MEASGWKWSPDCVIPGDFEGEKTLQLTFRHFLKKEKEERAAGVQILWWSGLAVRRSGCMEYEDSRWYCWVLVGEESHATKS